MPQRMDYNRVAHIFDTDRHRVKEVDPDLKAFLAKRSSIETRQPVILDVGCGTGSQLSANLTAYPWLTMIGLDFHAGMVRQAQKKARQLNWLQGNGAFLPLKSASVDYITNQFSFHHIQNKKAMIKALFRVLKPGGLFVMSNISPRDMPNWIYYRYFPEAKVADWQDFMPTPQIESLLRSVGFKQVEINLSPQQYERDLHDFAQEVEQRISSQLWAISDADYEAGRRRIQAELAQSKKKPVLIPSAFCLLKIKAYK